MADALTKTQTFTISVSIYAIAAFFILLHLGLDQQWAFNINLVIFGVLYTLSFLILSLALIAPFAFPDFTVDVLSNMTEEKMKALQEELSFNGKSIISYTFMIGFFVYLVAYGAVFLPSLILICFIESLTFRWLFTNTIDTLLQ